MKINKNNFIVSVIVVTKNEGDNISRCLSSIRNQSYSKKLVETIVVDNNSTDRTKEIARKYTDKVFDKGPERSAQRNFGVSKAKGDWFIFLDADMILSKEVIEACVSKIQKNPKLVGLYISEIVIGKSFFSKVRRFERRFYDATIIDGVRFIKKEKFIEIGGFDENMYACEDWDLDKRLKALGQFDLVKNPIFHNEEDIVIYKYFRKKSYYVNNFDVYIEKWGKEDGDLKKQLGFYYRFFGVFTENGKWKKLLRHPLLSIGLFFLRVLVGIAFIKKGKKKKNIKYKKNIQSNIEKLPSISFVIPVYNAEKHLTKCLESIKKQTYPKSKIESLIIDGGSTDKTLEIANKYNVKILHNEKRIAEFGKAIGIKESVGDYFILLDSDNELVEDYWIQEMVYPILDEPNLFGVESPFSYDEKLSSLNRYFGRMRINDPLAKLLVDKPSILDKGRYRILKYKKNGVLLTGANGFLWNRKVVMNLDGWGEKFEEGNFGTKIHSLLGVNYAVSKNISTRHYYVDGLIDYFKKRKKIALKVRGRMERKEFIWASNVGKAKFFFVGIYSVSIIGPLLESIFKGLRDKTLDWLWHPIVSFITVFIYFLYTFLLRSLRK